MSLILWLPEDAALWRAMHPDRWAPDRELLAVVAERVDIVAELLHMHAGHFVQAHTRSRVSWPSWKPLQIRRPGMTAPEPEPSGMSPFEFVSMFKPRGGDPWQQAQDEAAGLEPGM